jgi:predicted AAA+ superfamily ATPase
MMGLLEIISSSPGMTINMDNLGSAVGKDRKTISAYLRYLEDCMLIRLVSNGRRSVIARIRKGMRAYPTSTGLVYAFKGYTPDDVTRGKILETAIANELRSDRYWRQGRKEIDFILGIEGGIAIEVKSSGEGKLHFKAYASKANIKKAFVISDRRTGKSSAEGIEYDIVPAWALCAGASIPGLNG